MIFKYYVAINLKYRSYRILTFLFSRSLENQGNASSSPASQADSGNDSPSGVASETSSLNSIPTNGKWTLKLKVK